MIFPMRWLLCCVLVFHQDLMFLSSNWTVKTCKTCNRTYTPTALSKDEILQNHASVLGTFNIPVNGSDEYELPYLYWIPKLHKNPYKQRYIAGSREVGQACSSCGHPARPPSQQHHNDHMHRVIGGEETRMGSLPWMAMLTENGAQVCGGSIVSDRLILTAAHCFEKAESLDVRRWRVIVGKHHLLFQDLFEQTHTINRIIMHEGYDNVTVRNDIAILVLNNHVMYNSFVMPVCLPGFSLSSLLSHHGHSTTYGIVAGWGITREDYPKYVLNQVTLPILNDRVCAAHDWYGSLFLPQTTFCAGYEQGGRDACAGDSGSPFIIKYHNGIWVQIGITSWGLDCAQPRLPGIYTDVTMYMTWIKQKAEMCNVYFPYFAT